MTLPREPERIGRELIRRLAQFRNELNVIGETPSRDTLERLIRRAHELGLRENDVKEELEQLRASVEALDLKARVSQNDLPTAEPPDTLPSGRVCHFVSVVRFGRRRADQFGHLVLSSASLTFLGALDVSVAWSEVAAVRRDGREIAVNLHDSRRILRFSCHTYGEAARGGVLAEHLAQIARAHTPRESPHYHASV